MNSPAQKIKERLSIEEVVSSYIKLEKAGKNLKAKCPFHGEKTASFFVSPERGSYYCFGCGTGGDIFTFVEEFEGLDFKGALKMLADRAGVPLESYNPKEENERDRLYRVMEESMNYFISNLKGNKEVLEYIKSRGLTEDSVKDFQVGFAQLLWRDLYSHLRNKKFTDEDIERAGLAKKSEKSASSSGGYYDRFRGRIMFPIMDTSGRVIAFSGRIFVDDGKSAKYLNSPETPIFSKSAVLFGLNRAKDSIRKNNFSILVEGQIDLLLSHQAGYRNTVATSGTALSDTTLSKENVISNLGLVRRLSPNIVLAFDGDKAGFKAVLRAGKIALSLGMDVKVAALPDGVDPADLISKSGVPAWRESIKNSKHLIEFLVQKVLNTGGDARKAGREIKEKVLPYVAALESSIEKMQFVKKISDMAGIPEGALKDDLKKVEVDFESEKKEIEVALESPAMYRKDKIVRKLIGIVLWQKGLKKEMMEIDKVLEKLAKVLDKKSEEIIAKVKDEREDLIFEAETFYQGGETLEKDVTEMLWNLEEEELKEKLTKKMQELRLAEESKDFEKSSVILSECKVINDKIQSIKNGRFKK